MGSLSISQTRVIFTFPEADAYFCYSEQYTISSVMILYNKCSSIHIPIIPFLLY